MRPIGNVIETLSDAFRPLHCGIELVGHGETLRFRVFDEANDDLLRSQCPLERLRDDRALQRAIHEARLSLSESGYRLQRWQMPPA